MNEASVTIGTVAPRLGVSDDTVRRWADAGLIPSYKLPSGHRRFLASDVEQFRVRLLAGEVCEAAS